MLNIPFVDAATKNNKMKRKKREEGNSFQNGDGAFGRGCIVVLGRFPNIVNHVPWLIGKGSFNIKRIDSWQRIKYYAWKLLITFDSQFLWVRIDPPLAHSRQGNDGRWESITLIREWSIGRDGENWDKRVQVVSWVLKVQDVGFIQFVTVKKVTLCRLYLTYNCTVLS